MSEQMINIDIERIMDEIRENIKRRGYKEEDIDFENITGNVKAVLGVKTDFSSYEFEHSLKTASSLHYIEYYRMIPKGGLKSFIQRLIRKIVKFMMIPMVDQQNQYNYHIIMCMRQLEGFTKEQQMLLDQKERAIDELEEKVFQLTKKYEALENRLKDREVKA